MLNNTLCEFDGTVFPGDIDFSYKKLPSVSFGQAKFAENANFREAKFGVYGNFSEATFGKNANFFAAIFGENTDFIGTKFDENADFSFAKFGGSVYFNYAKFGEDADFREAEFKGHVDLGAKFKRVHFLGDTFLGEADLNGLTVDEEVRFKGVDFKHVLLDGAEMDKMRFEHCSWDDKTDKGRLVISDEPRLIKYNNDKQIKQAEEIYRTLKQRHKEMHNEGMAGLFHASEKLMLTKRTRLMNPPEGIKRSSKIWWSLKKYFDMSTLSLYNLSSGYGGNPFRAALALLIIFVISLMAFGCVGIEHTVSHQPALITLSTVTAAALEFLTLQREPLYTIAATNPFGRIVRVFFFLLVYAQTLLFVFALRNRLRR